MAPGASASPLTLSRSAVLRNAGNWSCETFTSPAYMNSRMACKWLYATSFRIIIGCLDGFSYNIYQAVNYLQLFNIINYYLSYCNINNIPLTKIWNKDYRRTRPFYALYKFDHRKPTSHPWNFFHLADVWTTTPCSIGSRSI